MGLGLASACVEDSGAAGDYCRNDSMCDEGLICVELACRAPLQPADLGPRVDSGPVDSGTPDMNPPPDLGPDDLGVDLGPEDLGADRGERVLGSALKQATPAAELLKRPGVDHASIVAIEAVRPMLSLQYELDTNMRLAGSMTSREPTTTPIG